ncbi:GntR family transcriptional regulator [Salibacterium halotolerans]|uniref:GntR family transcriptional regulator n=1 Tax=Salibacterium halotolerans TaxID=1884432 RepID=A0A1I5R1Q7_9BACI|nr:GntR family transcriptional regulator [Salibacterium halotolerans]SFP52429.1 GntR family transcriptional regulator [Salibacterium halotolerans]
MTNQFQHPRYVTVIEEIKEKIRNGELEPGERLPSENEYAKQLHVSRNTLREALRILEEEHIMVRKHGIGTFVNKKPVFSGGIEELFSITDMIEREGKTPGTDILFTGFTEPHGDDKKELTLDEQEQVYLIKRIRTADDDPLVYCVDKIPAGLLEDDYNLDEESMLLSLEKKAGVTISYAKANIETMGYHEEISTMLQCENGSPLLVLKQVHYDMADEPVLYSINFFKSDQISFNVFRRRQL